jgi:hypothetical protein
VRLEVCERGQETGTRHMKEIAAVDRGEISLLELPPYFLWSGEEF